ncbi:MAG: hypothetical protein JW990_21220 [Thermoleophilia bacterium]|nr:hypothetical protein [Thermoleophilia bacterium]
MRIGDRHGTPVQLGRTTARIDRRRPRLPYPRPGATRPGGTGGIPGDGGSGTGNPQVPDSPTPKPYLSVLDFGAIGNSVADDRAAFVAALAAGQSEGLPVYAPPGTYGLSGYLSFKPGMHLFGAGPATLLSLGAAGRLLYAWQGGADMSVKMLGLSGTPRWNPSALSDVVLFEAIGVQGLQVADVQFAHALRGLHLSTEGAMNTGVVVERSQFSDCYQGLFTRACRQSTFRQLDIHCHRLGTYRYHGMYVTDDTQDCLYEDILATGAGGYCVHVWGEHPGAPMRNLIFRRVTADCSASGRYPVVMGDPANMLEDVTWEDCTLECGVDKGAAVYWYDNCRNVQMTGLDISGPPGSYTHGGSPQGGGAYPAGCSMSGTYGGGMSKGSVPGVDTSGLVAA